MRGDSKSVKSEPTTYSCSSRTWSGMISSSRCGCEPRDFKQVRIGGDSLAIRLCHLHMKKLLASAEPVRLAESWALDVPMEPSLLRASTALDSSSASPEVDALTDPRRTRNGRNGLNDRAQEPRRPAHGANPHRGAACDVLSEHRERVVAAQTAQLRALCPSRTVAAECAPGEPGSQRRAPPARTRTDGWRSRAAHRRLKRLRGILRANAALNGSQSSA